MRSNPGKKRLSLIKRSQERPNPETIMLIIEVEVISAERDDDLKIRRKSGSQPKREMKWSLKSGKSPQRKQSAENRMQRLRLTDESVSEFVVDVAAVFRDNFLYLKSPIMYLM